MGIVISILYGESGAQEMENGDYALSQYGVWRSSSLSDSMLGQEVHYGSLI